MSWRVFFMGLPLLQPEDLSCWSSPAPHRTRCAGEPTGVLVPLQVISNRMQKSVLVAIDRFVKNKKYDRVLKRTTKLMVGHGSPQGTQLAAQLWRTAFD